MDLIEARRLHADDESVKRLRADKDAADIKLKHAREELNAITAEYKRLVATKNAKDKVRVSGSVTANKACIFEPTRAPFGLSCECVIDRPTDGHSLSKTCLGAHRKRNKNKTGRNKKEIRVI